MLVEMFGDTVHGLAYDGPESKSFARQRLMSPAAKIRLTDDVETSTELELPRELDRNANVTINTIHSDSKINDYK